MTPSAIIARATADGVSIALAASGNIKASGARAAVDKWLPAIRANKPAIIAALKAEAVPSAARSVAKGNGQWDIARWHVHFGDRASRGSPLGAAQICAYECCVSEWLDQNPVRSEPGRCLRCGASGAGDALIPFGTAPMGHAWLHAGCWPDWFADRKAQAREALAALGIVAPSGAKGGRDGYH